MISVGVISSKIPGMANILKDFLGEVIEKAGWDLDLDDRGDEIKGAGRKCGENDVGTARAEGLGEKTSILPQCFRSSMFGILW